MSYSAETKVLTQMEDSGCMLTTALDPRLVGTRRWIIKVPKTSPCDHTTNQSEESPQAATFIPNVAFKNPSLKATRKLGSFEHELPVLA